MRGLIRTNFVWRYGLDVFRPVIIMKSPLLMATLSGELNRVFWLGIAFYLFKITGASVWQMVLAVLPRIALLVNTRATWDRPDALCLVFKKVFPDTFQTLGGLPAQFRSISKA